MIMQHKCKVTVLETKVFSDLQEKYLADPQSAPYLLFGEWASLDAIPIRFVVFCGRRVASCRRHA